MYGSQTQDEKHPSLIPILQMGIKGKDPPHEPIGLYYPFHFSGMSKLLSLQKAFKGPCRLKPKIHLLHRRTSWVGRLQLSLVVSQVDMFKHNCHFVLLFWSLGTPISVISTLAPRMRRQGFTILSQYLNIQMSLSDGLLLTYFVV